ncbi:MAG: DNA polymerase III subunit psi [Aeromonas sp.]
MLDAARQRLLARMGISQWQVRHPAVYGLSAEAPATPASALPAAKLLLALPSTPAPALLADIAAYLALKPSELVCVTPEALAAGELGSAWLWLAQPDARYPAALHCPAQPTAAQKRALWQQLKTLR